MRNAERLLRTLLRLVGSVTMLALVPLLMPTAWLAGIHEWLALGKFPEGPVVEYLARSVSAFYAILGGLFWLVSFDVRRYAAVIIYLAVIFVVFGVVILVIDVWLDLPLWWSLVEGPLSILLGIVVLALQRHVRQAAAPARSREEAQQ